MLCAEIDGNIPHNRESEFKLRIGIQLRPVGREGSIITENEALKNIKQILENYINTTPPKYYPPVENLLDLIYETYTESNPAAPKTTAAGRAARARDKEFEAWLREIPGMDILVEDCVGGKISLWEEIMVRQGRQYFAALCAILTIRMRRGKRSVWNGFSFHNGLASSPTLIRSG